jgi:hypothetical protein
MIARKIVLKGCCLSSSLRAPLVGFGAKTTAPQVPLYANAYSKGRSQRVNKHLLKTLYLVLVDRANAETSAADRTRWLTMQLQKLPKVLWSKYLAQAPPADLTVFLK